jgi:phospholipase C
MSRRPSRRSTRRRALAALVAGTAVAGLLVPGEPAGAQGPEADPVSSIQKVVVVVEQDHTFDSYFGVYPGANGLEHAPPPLLPNGSGGRASFSDYDEATFDKLRPHTGSSPLDNSVSTARFAARGAVMDKVLIAQQRANHQPDAAVLMHNATTAAPVWSVAEQGVLFDNYYSSELGGSVPNMLTMLTGGTLALDDGDRGTLATLAGWTGRTVFDRLHDRGRSWRYYVGGIDRIDPGKVLDGTYVTTEATSPAALYRVPILSMKRFWAEPALRAGLAGQDDFYRDAASGHLPDVSFVSPSPSDYPVSTSQFAQARLLSVVNALTKSPDWPHLAVFVVWDDWGGFFDHVRPRRGDGFRVPLILLSPWARQGLVDGRRHNHLSILSFIVDRFGLEPLSARQAAVGGFDEAFRSRASAARPVFTVRQLARSPVGTSRQNAFTLAIYLAGVVVLAGVLWAARRRWRGAMPVKADDAEPLAPTGARRPPEEPGGPALDVFR